MKEEINLEDILAGSERDDLVEVPLPEGVFKSLRWLIITAAILIAGQVIYLGGIQKKFYFKRSLANANEVRVEPAARGLILDRYGKPLIKNEPVFNVFLEPKNLPKDALAREAGLQRIREELKFSEEDFVKRLKGANWQVADRLFLTNNLSHEELLTLSATSVPGLAIEPGFRRLATAPLTASHVIGYVGRVNNLDLAENSSLSTEDEIGRSGLEAYYDAELRGQNGKKILIRSATGVIEEEIISETAQTGGDLKTFIDADLQNFFYERLFGALKNLGRDTGAGLVLNPQNGEVLALVAIPSFDVNQVADVLDDPKNPLFNRVVSGLYAPGSTIKPLVGLAALEEGVVSTEDSVFSAGFIDVPNPYNPSQPSRFLDWKAHGWVDIYGALARSSNIYFYAVGGGIPDTASPLGLGIERLKQWWQKFNLDQKTGIDLVGEKAGILPDPRYKEAINKEPWRLGDTYNVSIGQGDLLVTPLELLNYIAAIANGGYLYAPRLADDGRAPILNKDISEEIRNFLPDVRRGMREVVTETYGSGYILHDLPLAVAVKTGTAQIEDNAKTNAFVVGYAPFDNPEIAVLVLVENAREGSLNVLPVVKDIFLWYYENRLRLPPSD